MFKRKCSIAIPTFMSSRLQVLQSGDILIAVSELSLSWFRLRSNGKCSIKIQGLPLPWWWGRCRRSPCGRRSFLPGVKILPAFGTDGLISRDMPPGTWWCPFSLLWRDELVSWVFIVCILFPVSSGSWVSESGAARVKRECWGWKSSTPHGFLHLLRFYFQLYYPKFYQTIANPCKINDFHPWLHKSYMKFTRIWGWEFLPSQWDSWMSSPFKV